MRAECVLQLLQAIADIGAAGLELARGQAEMLAGWSLVEATARRHDARTAGAADREVSMQAACTKMFTTEMFGRVADRGVRIHGGAGDINDYKVERFYRDVRLYEGTTQIQQRVIGRHLLRDACNSQRRMPDSTTP